MGEKYFWESDLRIWVKNIFRNLVLDFGLLDWCHETFTCPSTALHRHDQLAKYHPVPWLRWPNVSWHQVFHLPEGIHDEFLDSRWVLGFTMGSWVHDKVHVKSLDFFEPCAKAAKYWLLSRWSCDVKELGVNWPGATQDLDHRNFVFLGSAMAWSNGVQ